ncbi:MAG TPA: 2OG-Fe(II) oxygenase [Dongiaceae bacterium]|jgi:hypothetical protein|nr:2OG-Fe(II) oxygenase [Dongiaceae bacterium]
MLDHTSRQMIDLERLEQEKAELRQRFVGTTPFPAIVIDNFLRPGWCDRLGADFCAVLSAKNPDDLKKHKHVLRKVGMSKMEKLSDNHRAFFHEIYDPLFMDTLAYITGYSKLYSDFQLFGGGLHETWPGGFLNVHTDFNVHPSTGKMRALNLLLYLNPDWKPEYEGYLELWPASMDRCAQRIAPLQNRAVIFQTSDISFHGHPIPLACPEGTTRRSLAVYYYADWPDGLKPRTKTNYVFTPLQRQAVGAEMKKLYEAGCHNEDAMADALPNYERGAVIRLWRELYPRIGRGS